MGRFIPVPGISAGILDSSCYYLCTAKELAEVFHLDGELSKLSESKQPEEKIPMFSSSETVTVHKSENVSSFKSHITLRASFCANINFLSLQVHFFYAVLYFCKKYKTIEIIPYVF